MRRPNRSPSGRRAASDVPSRRAAAGIPTELTGKSSLVVDDNAITRRILDLQTEAARAEYLAAAHARLNPSQFWTKTFDLIRSEGGDPDELIGELSGSTGRQRFGVAAGLSPSWCRAC